MLSVDESARFFRSVTAAYRAVTPLLDESMDMPDYEWLTDLMGSPVNFFANTLRLRRRFSAGRSAL